MAPTPNVFYAFFIVTALLVQFIKQDSLNQNNLKELKKLDQLLKRNFYISQLENAFENSNDHDASVYRSGRQLKEGIDKKKRKSKFKLNLNQKSIQHRLFIG
jgi:hypothetical protein